MGSDARGRRPMAYVPLPGEGGWLGLADDDLLDRILSLGPDHTHDDELIGIVRSDRHLFVRQEAARRVRDDARLQALTADRHVGPILSRKLRRDSDLVYLENLAHNSRFSEVRRVVEDELERRRPFAQGRT
jgi:hypothetical protein